MKDDYLVHIDALRNIQAKDLPKFFNSIRGIPLKELKLSDLIFFDDKPILSGNGAYIFKTETDYLYIGDCSSRNFGERIGGHFDLRTTAWMNRLFKNLVKRKEQPLTNENLAEVAREVIEDASLILINFDFHPTDHKILVDTIDKFEKVLMVALQPYNKVNRPIDLNKTVQQLIF